MRGLFYLYVLIWIEDCLKLILEIKEVYIEFIDKYV